MRSSHKIVPMKVSEHDHQASLMQTVRAHVHKHPLLDRLYAIPNGGKLPYKRMVNRATGKPYCYSPERTKLMAEGMKPGVVDLFLSAPSRGYHGFYLEMKAEPNEPTKEQYEWLADSLSLGYYADWCSDWITAWGVICWYLSIPNAVR